MCEFQRSLQSQRKNSLRNIGKGFLAMIKFPYQHKVSAPDSKVIKSVKTIRYSDMQVPCQNAQTEIKKINWILTSERVC